VGDQDAPESGPSLGAAITAVSQPCEYTSASQGPASRWSTSGRPITVTAIGSRRSRTSRRAPSTARRHRRSHPSRTGPPDAGRPAAGRVCQCDRNRRASGDPEPPGNCQQMDHGVGGPADGGYRHDRVGNEACVRNVLGRRSAATICTTNRPVPWAASSSRLSAAGVPATPGTTVPSASATSAIVDAAPMVLQCPRLRIMADSERVNCSAERVLARTLLRQPPDIRSAFARTIID
jgi:hypothetical protein